MRLRKCCQHDRRSHRRWCRCRALAQLLFALQRCRRFGFHGQHHGSTAMRPPRALLPGPQATQFRRGPATHPLVAAGTCRSAPDDGDPRIHSYLRGDPPLTIYLRGTHSRPTGTPGYPSTGVKFLGCMADISSVLLVPRRYGPSFHQGGGRLSIASSTTELILNPTGGSGGRRAPLLPRSCELPLPKPARPPVPVARVRCRVQRAARDMSPSPWHLRTRQARLQGATPQH